MGKIWQQEGFNMKDLTLSVNLSTCINGTSYDFTGRKTFDVGFYKENVGFGITNIDIDVNPSLQPIIDITFKDLYGNSIFGTQRGKGDVSLDTSVLFNWPPPKFIFSFKGYLGREVTWLLNLKTTNITYVPTDGSYEVKCSFVPNQWGFLADMPVLYLHACKKLRVNRYKAKEKTLKDGCVFSSDSIFSYVKIGKKIDSKTKEGSKEFESLKNQLSLLKYNPKDALYGAKNVQFNKPIVGIVNNIEVQGFRNIFIPQPLNEDLSDLDSESKKTDNIGKFNTFFQ